MTYQQQHMVDVFQLPTDSFAELHFWNDPSTHLKAIVAIHNTTLGPALGGTRFIKYLSTDIALADAIRLARGMTYKSAINQLPFGGGKAVILEPEEDYNRHALFTRYADFIDSLAGRYIAAVDSGTSPTDMDIMSERTRHVVCTTRHLDSTGDPSPYTARGVVRGMQAALMFRDGNDQLKDRHIAIQGVGHVGYALVRILHGMGAKITVCDTNQKLLEDCARNFACNIVRVEQIYQVECDVFSPCALGQIINESTISKMSCSIIAGSANNQLISEDTGDLLLNKGILYAPDYVVNSGGLLQIAYINQPELINRKIDQLYDRLLEIFDLSEKQRISTNLVANDIAEKILQQAGKNSNYKAVM